MTTLASNPVFTLTIGDAMNEVCVNGKYNASARSRRAIVQYAMSWVNQTWKNADDKGKIHAIKGKVNLILERRCACTGFGKDEKGWAEFRTFADGLIPEPTQNRAGDADEFLAALDAEA